MSSSEPPSSSSTNSTDSNSSPPSPSQNSAPPPESNSTASPPPSNSPPPKPSSSPPPPDAPPPTPASSPPPESSPPPPPPPDSSPPPPTPVATPPKPSKSPPPPPSPSNSGPPPSPPAPPPSTPPPSKSPPSPSSPPPSHSLTSPPPSGQDSPPPPPPPRSPPIPATSPQSPPPPPGTVAPPSTPTQSPSPPTRNSTAIGTGVPPTPNGTSHSTPTSSSPPANTTSSATGAVVGGAVAGVVMIAFLALVFLLMRRKKKRVGNFAGNYAPPPHFPGQPDASNYYGPKGHTIVFAGQTDSFYGSQAQNSASMSSFGSQMGGNVYHGGGPDSGILGGAKSFFSYEELMEITNGFSRQNVIGEGGFGCVYKGQLSDGKVVAVKQLKAGSGQGDREFRAEVEIISRVHHRHLVSLVGYCISEHQRLLIYEFVPNNTLEHHLHGKGMPVLDWTKRLKIALGSAKGLAYLHEDCHPKIIHRDIKSANILLDDVFEAQVADFGLAKLTNDTNTHVSTRVMGTFGYLAPEYASSGKLTDRSDVFSFGVVLLELVTGRKPVDPTQPLGDESLVEWARPLLITALESGDFSELVDPRLGKNYIEHEMVRMIEAAAACIRHSAPKRPRMAQVVRALDCEGEMSDLSNGVKYGQSTIYNSGQYSEDIMRFRRMALGGDDSMEYGTSSEYTASKDLSNNGNQTSCKSRDSSGEYTSSYDSETRAMNAPHRNR